MTLGHGRTYSDLTQRFLPGLVIEAFPDRPIDFRTAKTVLQSMAPTKPFENEIHDKPHRRRTDEYARCKAWLYRVLPINVVAIRVSTASVFDPATSVADALAVVCSPPKPPSAMKELLAAPTPRSEKPSPGNQPMGWKKNHSEHAGQAQANRRELKNEEPPYYW